VSFASLLIPIIALVQSVKEKSEKGENYWSKLLISLIFIALGVVLLVTDEVNVGMPISLSLFMTVCIQDLFFERFNSLFVYLAWVIYFLFNFEFHLLMFLTVIFLTYWLLTFMVEISSGEPHLIVTSLMMIPVKSWLVFMLLASLLAFGSLLYKSIKKGAIKDTSVPFGPALLLSIYILFFWPHFQ